MFRRKLIELLSRRELTLREISRETRTPIRDVEDDLRHLEKSLRRDKRRINVRPAKCRKCGFAFGAEKFHKPSRCPECKGSWIEEPAFSII